MIEACFAELARSFACAHPPRQADLYDYGASFPRFLRDAPVTRGLPYLAEVARFEWAVSRALHAPDVPALTPADLAAAGAHPPDDPGALRLLAHPAVHALALVHPGRRIAEATLGGDDAALATLDLADGEWLLVHRSGTGLALEVAVWDLDAREVEFAAALLAGSSLDEAFAATPDVDHGAVLGGMVARGCFTAPTSAVPWCAQA
ncbi:MAG: putative DNA-binding domain-containing protein [Acetobacteraceae bacterium]